MEPFWGRLAARGACGVGDMNDLRSLTSPRTSLPLLRPDFNKYLFSKSRRNQSERN